MKKLDDDVDDLKKIIAKIENSFIMAFLMLIEKTYQINDNMVGMSYDLPIKDQQNKLSTLLNPANIKLLDDEGFSLLSNINYKELANFVYLKQLVEVISDNENKVEEHKKSVVKIFEDLSVLTNREERFSVYKKHMHGKIPGYNNLIENWKNGVFVEDIIAIKEKDGYGYINSFNNLNLKTNESLQESINSLKKSYLAMIKKYNEHRILKYLSDAQEIVDNNKNVLEGFIFPLNIKSEAYSPPNSAGIIYQTKISLGTPSFIYNNTAEEKEYQDFNLKNDANNLISLQLNNLLLGANVTEYNRNHQIKNINSIFDMLKEDKELLGKVLRFKEEDYNVYKAIYEKEKISKNMILENNKLKPAKRL